MEAFKKYWPYVVIIALFYVVAYLFTPQVLSNKVVNQSDIAAWRGMANEIINYNEANPDKDPALWTNSMFGGMPATAISVIYKGDYTDYFYRLIHKLSGTRPPAYLLISLIGSFLLFLAFGVNVWLSAIGAFAMTFCSYNMQIIQVGHNSKMVAIAFMPWVLAAITYAYRKNCVLGSLFFAFALSFQIKANHPQITYYLAMIVVAFAIAQLYKAVKERCLPLFIKKSALLLVAGILGIAVNINHLWPTYEYSKYTMRGGSELALEQGKDQRGLDISYATSWSYSPGEMPNLMIPNFNGGASGGKLSRDSETYRALNSAGYRGADQIIRQLPLYWGPQPFTAGPMYMGAISIFLFILGLIVLKGPLKWWIAGVSLLAVLLSWGSNLLFLTEFFFKNIPLYSKFRTVSMILVILQVTIPLLAIITLSKLTGKEKLNISRDKFKRALTIALALTAGFSFIFVLIPSLAGSFVSSADAGMPDVLKQSLVADRISLLRADALRSLGFILTTAGVVWFAFTGKLKRNLMYGALALLVVIDLWFVGKRYLNDSHFIRRTEFENQYALRPVDIAIKEDKDPNYRVLDLSVNTFNDSHISYHHKTIGGYSPAKLQIYQDIIDRHISGEIGSIAQDLGESATIEQAQESLGYYPVLSMLNTRYIVIAPDNAPLFNSQAFGNSWFATSVRMVESLSSEINMLDINSGVNIKNTAVVHSDFTEAIRDYSSDSLSASESIQLISYEPNKLVYSYNAEVPRIAVFSEIYYPAGWRATVNGAEAEIFRVNYLLRGLKVPPGNNIVEFEFKPRSFTKGELMSRIISGLLLVLTIAAITGQLINYKRIWKNNKQI